MRKFDRPPPPHDWRWWVGSVGKTLIAVGLLMFGFVAYQLWGTGIETARAQNALENEFNELLAVTTSTAPTTTAPTTTVTEPPVSAPVDSVPATTVPQPPVQDLPQFEEGDAVARLEIPRIGADDIVVAGVSKGDLKKGPGHYPETPMPGQLGNSAIAGHRTTYGQPFFDIGEVEYGDELIVTTLAGRFVYRVTDQQIVSPSDYHVVATTDPTRATLTLTSCHPKWTARERIIVSAELDPDASSGPAGQPLINYGRPLGAPTAEAEPDDSVVVDISIPATTAPTDTASTTAGQEPATQPDTTEATVAAPAGPAPGSDELSQGIADAFSDGWFSDPGANSQVGLWGLLLGAIGIAAYLLSRKTKRDWVGLFVGILPFAVALYFFFQNVNRLLPPNL